MPIPRNLLREQVLALGWFQFQNLLAGAFRKQGYQVNVTPRVPWPAADIDLVLSLEEERIAVRCHPADALRAGERLLRRFVQARQAARIPTGILISAAGFTDEAQESARIHDVEPWDLPEIVHLLEHTHAPDDPALRVWLTDRRRICPHCGIDATGYPSGCVASAPIRCLQDSSRPDCRHTFGIWAEHERVRQQVATRSRQEAERFPSALVPVTMEMVICAQDAARSRARFTPTHMISLHDPGADATHVRPPWIPPENHYIGFFYDVRDPRHPLAPRENEIQSVIDWLGPRCAPGVHHRFLIHGEAGLGRSPAVGYVAWALHLGPGREREAWDLMIASCVRSSIVPNALVIGHADSILRRSGALIERVRRWSIPIALDRMG